MYVWGFTVYKLTSCCTNLTYCTRPLNFGRKTKSKGEQKHNKSTWCNISVERPEVINNSDAFGPDTMPALSASQNENSSPNKRSSLSLNLIPSIIPVCKIKIMSFISSHTLHSTKHYMYFSFSHRMQDIL